MSYKISRFVLLGTNSTTLHFASVVKDRACLAGIISMPEESRPNSSTDLKPFALLNSIPYAEFSDINVPEAVHWIKDKKSDYILASWPHIIKKEVLNLPARFIIGTHPTPIPVNRGRHPLHWMVSLGIKSSYYSFFNMDDGVDSGPVLYQEPFFLDPGGTINSANNSMDKAAKIGLNKLLDYLELNPDYIGKKQNQNKASYWRKKTMSDITIDPRMSRNDIQKIVNSFTLPYPCAILIFKSQLIKVLSTAIDLESKEENIQREEPGKIINLEKNKLKIKVADGLIVLISNEDLEPIIKNSKYIYPPTHYFLRYSEHLINKMN